MDRRPSETPAWHHPPSSGYSQNNVSTAVVYTHLVPPLMRRQASARPALGPALGGTRAAAGYSSMWQPGAGSTDSVHPHLMSSFVNAQPGQPSATNPGTWPGGVSGPHRNECLPHAVGVPAAGVTSAMNHSGINMQHLNRHPNHVGYGQAPEASGYTNTFNNVNMHGYQSAASNVDAAHQNENAVPLADVQWSSQQMSLQTRHGAVPAYSNQMVSVSSTTRFKVTTINGMTEFATVWSFAHSSDFEEIVKELFLPLNVPRWQQVVRAAVLIVGTIERWADEQGGLKGVFPHGNQPPPNSMTQENWTAWLDDVIWVLFQILHQHAFRCFNQFMPQAMASYHVPHTEHATSSNLVHSPTLSRHLPLANPASAATEYSHSPSVYAAGAIRGEPSIQVQSTTPPYHLPLADTVPPDTAVPPTTPIYQTPRAQSATPSSHVQGTTSTYHISHFNSVPSNPPAQSADDPQSQILYGPVGPSREHYW
ncbi:hypothetical protein LXA43DRAFT_1064647 [Ganoderma leucocontextum]|nr:hypothetical protein LXA43DRAFT_1064647 [Ganoderma leucocontextum]